ncbi:MAG: hypothetical protein ACO3T9_06660 [Ilumatobacteraceae bacterium]|jgi:hypothetical protein
MDREIGLMLFYSCQALLLGLALLLIARQNGKFSNYSILYVFVWTVSVIAIRLKYGVDQVNFYSSDQQTQLEMYERLLINGLLLSPQQFVADRYLIIVPVRIFDIFGIEPILATKFLQAVCLLLLYRVCVKFLEQNDLRVRLYHAIFFVGPLFIFLSTLGLRDLEIALATTYFFLGQNTYLKQFSLLVLLPLRPHLAVSLAFGWLFIKIFKKFNFRRIYVALIVVTFFAFTVGGYGFIIGRNIRDGNAIVAPQIFDQDPWWRFFSNLVGLQFLAFDDRTVNLSVVNLLSLRLIFIDSFLIPICFVITLLSQKLEFTLNRIQVFLSFTFFLGLAAQTDFNSTRQNLPFLSTMGVLALLGLVKRGDNATLKSLENSSAKS